ncbi:E3 ubiquitin-protein ligase RGLG2-like isoform X1 [Phoenix dactylifera]|uniref:E3 ubiquitin-protein ligase RGLG2-like isoform X1 n=1 Tax=Phoenix dactylifera TaxID=42345 RepID=A0A8B9AIQ5_PHODC|nr:E3 ubiquitin-protein ligase RGLG2-like isoform X1 [Phoenix dactylifera]XP_026657372.2 E3 ubiquitin-protein ligase RGLG2-like isoform X1 [Phoenix dactylifera]XP_026657374.2 E3 ubiquitin-protein ligase RGLG2-like isoform X1 [Phoenix dactylifera]XP_038985651.1 E3 ubiquitin-protein ligase RGLG2-like isoform X1 [Phoenix dactylifera]XP_038985654.1 E3 ubiquitin-protein ligase RGLG2-like isoform X1 [Phoenix dactylifera]XP_038985655.1 E3 ubiquitin-protein ligase RGLG2-like isoform X1 [Phoenix dactyl
MGGKWSKSRSPHRYSHNYGTPPSRSTSRYSPYPGNNLQPRTVERVQRKYTKIGDDYHSLDQVTEALSQAGLESSNLIVGIDFTKSNEWTGRVSFNRRCLHDIGHTPNPYEQALSIIGRTLSAFDEDNLIPCFGFGDASTHDQEVFSFYPENRPCNGFEEALQRYKELVPHLRLAGPTSFAPIIETAIGIVDNSGGQYHVLLIIADGQVTRSVDTIHGQLSSQERDTMNAIVKASDYPLSIVLVGVGDGPWDMMREFDDNIPSRAFDNFQFVNFTEIMSRNISNSRKETEFALAALMEIPSQYKATIDLQLLGKRRGTPEMTSLPPPIKSHGSAYSNPKYSHSSSSEQGAGVHKRAPAIPSESSLEEKQVNKLIYILVHMLSADLLFYKACDEQITSKLLSLLYWICPICLWQAKNLAFGCGHQTCHKCGESLQVCPICQSQIATRIRLY